MSTQWWAVVPISAVVSASVTILLRWFDRPRPHLIALGHFVSTPVDTPNEFVKARGSPVSLTNVGTGAIYDLRVAGSLCVVGVRRDRDSAGMPTTVWDDRLAVLGAGEDILLDVQHKEPGARLVVSWPRSSAFRLWRRSRVWKLDELGIENPFPTALYAAQSIPRLAQWSGRIDRYGLRSRIMQQAMSARTDPAEKPDTPV